MFAGRAIIEQFRSLMGIGLSLRSESFSSEVDGGGILFGSGVSNLLLNGSGIGGTLKRVPELLLAFATDKSLIVVVLHPAVGDVDDINEGPDTESSEGEDLTDSGKDVSEVESVETDHTVRKTEGGSDPLVLGVGELGGDGVSSGIDGVSSIGNDGVILLQ